MYAGNIFIPELSGSRDGYGEATLKNLAQIAKRHMVNKVWVESNFGDGMFKELLKPYLQKVYPVSIDEIRQSQQKEKRIIDTLEPVMAEHRLVIDPKVIEQDHVDTEQDHFYSLFHQMTRITAERGALRHDDRLDVLAMAVACWVEQMAQDATKIHAQKKADELDAFIKKYGIGIPEGTGTSIFDQYGL